MAYQYDVIVIGSGPGGEGAAMQAVKHGKKVAVVERYDQIGGGCTHLGTIPSKALRYAIFQMTEANHNPLFREAGVSLRARLPELRRGPAGDRAASRHAARFLRTQPRAGLSRRQARFVDRAHDRSRRGERRSPAADGRALRHRHRRAPYRPPDVDFTHPRIFDSDTILDLTFTPQSITIYGAGVVGCEYTSMFRNLGLQGQPGQHARPSCWSFSTTKSSTP